MKSSKPCTASAGKRAHVGLQQELSQGSQQWGYSGAAARLSEDHKPATDPHNKNEILYLTYLPGMNLKPLDNPHEINYTFSCRSRAYKQELDHKPGSHLTSNSFALSASLHSASKKFSRKATQTWFYPVSSLQSTR